MSRHASSRPPKSGVFQQPAGAGVALVCVWLLVAACGRVDPATLPPLPELDLSEALPVVQEQIEQVHSRIADDPGDAEANGRLGMLLHAYRYLDAAEVCYRRARLLAPRTARWAYYHARVLEALGRNDAALAAMREAVALDERYTPARLGLAQLLEATGRGQESRSVLEALVAGAPDFAEAHYALGRMLHQADEPLAAATALERALALRPDDAPAHYALASVYRDLGKAERHAEHLRQYQTLSGRRPRVEDPLMAAVSRLGIGDAALIGRAQSLAAGGKLGEAIATLEQAVQNNPDSAAARATLIALYAQVGRYADADKQYAAGLAIEPDLAELHHNLGIARSLERRDVEAAAAFAKAVEINPARIESWLALARAYEAAGLDAQARDTYERALTIEPVNVSLRTGLARLLLAADEHARAAEVLSPLSTLASPDAGTLHLLAGVEAHAGRKREALALLERASEKVNRHAEARLATEIDIELRKLRKETETQ